ncbi:MAG: hypothetical protein QOG59_1105 [Solirubrobacteraceae bacterium]|nr:hypothetical protein [Solirubrobacteraceae bacterium]
MLKLGNVRGRTALRAAGIVLAAATALLVAAPAQAATQTASAGGVTAIFTYHGGPFIFHGDTLAIKRHGAVVYSAAVHAQTCGGSCGPNPGGKSVHVVDLEHNGTKDVVLDLYTEGAHCCFIEQVFYPSGAGYKKVERNIGNPGDEIVDLRHNGRLEFLTGNDAFSYKFTDYAASGFPIQILTFAHGRFHDVTRAYPKRIAKDAKMWLNAFKAMAKDHYSDSEGVIADYAADEYMLGHQHAVGQFLNQQANAGHLNALGSSLSGRKYVVALMKFLKHQGY